MICGYSSGCRIWVGEEVLLTPEGRVGKRPAVPGTGPARRKSMVLRPRNPAPVLTWDLGPGPARWWVGTLRMVPPPLCSL